ncbi:hypothetical protein OF83DRAFT_1062182, partial [Amylostereum chailletii]
MYAEERQCTNKVKKPGYNTISNIVEDDYFEETGRQVHIDHNTVCNHYKGKLSLLEACSKQCKLYPEESEQVIETLIECGARGFPWTHACLKDAANSILR